MIGEIQEQSLTASSNLPSIKVELKGEYNNKEINKEEYKEAFIRLPDIISGKEVLDIMYVDKHLFNRIDLFDDPEYSKLPLLTHEEEIVYIRALRFFEFMLNPQMGEEILEKDKLNRLQKDIEKRPQIPYFEEDENRYFLQLLNKQAGFDLNKNIDSVNNIKLFKFLDSGNTSPLEKELYILTAKEAIENIYRLLEFSNKRLVQDRVLHYTHLYNIPSDKNDIFDYAFPVIREKCIPKFSHTIGVRLATYFYPWIDQRCRRYIQNNLEAIRIPVHMKNKFFHMTQIIEEEERSIQANLKDDEILKLLSENNYQKFQIEAFLKYGRGECVLSLDSPMGKEGHTFYDSISQQQESPQHALERKEDYAFAMERTLNSGLTRKEFTAIYLQLGFFGEDIKTLEDIGNIMNVSRSRVEQLIKKSLRKITDPEEKSPNKTDLRIRSPLQTFQNEQEAREWIILNYWIPHTISKAFSLPKGEKLLNDKTYELIRMYYGLNDTKPHTIKHITSELRTKTSETQIRIKIMKEQLKNISIPITIIPGSINIYDYLEYIRSNRMNLSKELLQN